MSGLLLGAALGGVVLGFVNDQEIRIGGEPVAMASQISREGKAARLWHGLVERLRTGVELAPGAAGAQRLQSAQEGVHRTGRVGAIQLPGEVFELLGELAGNADRRGEVRPSLEGGLTRNLAICAGELSGFQAQRIRALRSLGEKDQGAAKRGGLVLEVHPIVGAEEP